jgi:hypoxanthine phosphoribosyltransferase
MSHAASKSKLRVLISAEQIQDRIAAMGKSIAAAYPTDPLYLVGVLKGSFIFMADLARAIPGNVRIEFLGVSSYGKGKTSSGEVRVTKDIDALLEGMDVLIVEDILDTGVTLTFLMNLFEQRKPRSIRIATLLDKPTRRLRPIRADWIGFEIPDEFVVGYGLDYAEDYRNLPDVCVVDSV